MGLTPDPGSAEDLADLDQAENYFAPIFGLPDELHPPLGKHVESTRLFAFEKDGLTSNDRSGMDDGGNLADNVRRKVPEEWNGGEEFVSTRFIPGSFFSIHR